MFISQKILCNHEWFMVKIADVGSIYRIYINGRVRIFGRNMPCDTGTLFINHDIFHVVRTNGNSPMVIEKITISEIVLRNGNTSNI